MGKCLSFLRINKRKYEERLETPPSRDCPVHLVSDEYIAAMKVFADNKWVVGQEKMISVFNEFLNTTFWECEERIRDMSVTEDVVYLGGKTIQCYSYDGKINAKFVGHERPVNSLDVVDSMMVSGSSDWSIRLWDLLSTKEISKNVIHWNVVTCVKWIDCQTVVQTSEDLKIRVWDIRMSSLKEAAVFNSGDNFATCCDAKDYVVITGHRGFDGDGTGVKMWDLRKSSSQAGNYCVFTSKSHSMSVESVKFLDSCYASCGKDGKIVVYKMSGEVMDTWSHPDSAGLNHMEVYNNGLLVSSIQPLILYFSLNPLTKQF